MAESRSTDRRERRRSLGTRLGHEIGRGVRGMGADERSGAIGVAIVCGSLLLPWYGVPIEGDLVKTGLGAFSFAEGALLLTVAAALVLLIQLGRGYEIPGPLSEGGLLQAAGVWAALLVIFRMFDRPRFQFVGFDERYNLRYGIFVALAGAITIVIAGIRARRHARHQRRRRERRPAGPAPRHP